MAEQKRIKKREWRLPGAEGKRRWRKRGRRFKAGGQGAGQVLAKFMLTLDAEHQYWNDGKR